MPLSPQANRVLDALHRGTVYFLAGTTVYLGVEIMRASWFLQKNKYERRAAEKASAPGGRACGRGAWAAIWPAPGQPGNQAAASNPTHIAVGGVLCAAGGIGSAASQPGGGQVMAAAAMI
jgi:hypothetical protein